MLNVEHPPAITSAFLLMATQKGSESSNWVTDTTDGAWNQMSRVQGCSV